MKRQRKHNQGVGGGVMCMRVPTQCVGWLLNGFWMWELQLLYDIVQKYNLVKHINSSIGKFSV
jgi:hypothetical protein